jgi:hypothetical protein
VNSLDDKNRLTWASEAGILAFGVKLTGEALELEGSARTTGESLGGVLCEIE